VAHRVAAPARRIAAHAARRRLAEELAQDALLAALETWPRDGVPDNPGAWLTATAKRTRHRPVAPARAAARTRGGNRARARSGSARSLRAGAAALDEDIEDDLLRLMFIACHPVLSPEAQVALTLRLLGGLTTTEIARAFLTPEPTVAQRIVRAKRALEEARAPFESPRGAERDKRIGAVLAVLYLVFNEGYAASAGEDWLRRSWRRRRCAWAGSCLRWRLHTRKRTACKR
jgi:predicted RNA polymerase sigma factor